MNYEEIHYNFSKFTGHANVLVLDHQLHQDSSKITPAALTASRSATKL
jgi:hypothetical protein